MDQPSVSRIAAVAVALTVGATAAGACRDIVTPDGTIDAVSELCATLESCYPDQYDCEALTSSVDTADDELVQLFLSQFEPASCLDSCSGARSCLDVPIFCRSGSASCSATEQCCDWTGGVAVCDADSGSCCAPRGAPCEGPGDPACCGDECISGVCGGTACGLVGQTCRWGFQCCTGRCEEDVCAELATCAELGEPCKDSAECCDVDVAECRASEPGGVETCQLIEMCAVLGEPCDRNGSDCCDGFECEVAIATNESVCVPTGAGGCKLAGFDCAIDADCCLDLICVLGVEQSLCEQPANACKKAGVDCASDGECCSQDCFAGFCLQGTGSECSPTSGSCHLPTVEGTVLRDDCSEAQLPCVASVESKDSYCKCTAWDGACVGAYNRCVIDGGNGN